jgi:hypothetical protein
MMLGGKLRPAASLYVFGQCSHGFLGNFDAFAAIDRRFGDVNGSEDFAAATFTLDPQRDCGLHGVLGTRKATAGDGLPDEILLLGGEVYLHALNLAGLAEKSRESMISTRWD